MLIATHDGSFHADEVFAIAALRLLGDPIEVVRTRDRDVLAGADLRIDVGFRSDPATGDFDHHQRDFDGGRENGIRYASFGLIWREFGVRVCEGDQEVADAVDASLVQGVDANDTGQQLSESLVEGVYPLTVNGVVGGFNARWDETLTPEQEHLRFDEALDLARGILAREVLSAASG
ncbi:MAG TPA: MYG1 family protein, partial [Solirubrobacteraceae bacterium]|nr:MYG1 family protein [Solirubrobacteraceae bacterium]